MKKSWYLFILMFWCTSCQHNHRVDHIDRAFYYWKSDYLDQDNVSAINRLQVNQLYIKLFEVDYSEARGNFPYEKNKPSIYEVRQLGSIKIIPTVFIRNGIFKYNDEKSLDKLADNLVFLVDRYSQDEDYSGVQTKLFDYDEIQIDCDWTKSTREKYFYLLRKIKTLSGKKISCTLRLYPYKYESIMGVPPVDKVTLMCYNLIKPLSQRSKNSILDLAELKKYLNSEKSYPLHIDIALPTFYWTQLYQNNRFVQLMDLSAQEVKTFAKPTKPLWYRVERDTSINYDTYLKAGDLLKCEEVSTSDILAAIDQIKKNVHLDKQVTVSLFDLDRSTFKKYSHEEISSFYSHFTK